MKVYNDSLVITKLNATIDLFSCLPEIFTAKDFKSEREKVNFCSRPYTLNTLKKAGVVTIVSYSTIHSVKTVPIYEVRDTYTKEILFEGTKKACDKFLYIRMKYTRTGWVDYITCHKYDKEEPSIERCNIRYSIDYEAFNAYLKANFGSRILEQIQKRVDKTPIL